MDANEQHSEYRHEMWKNTKCEKCGKNWFKNLDERKQRMLFINIVINIYICDINDSQSFWLLMPLQLNIYMGLKYNCQRKHGLIKVIVKQVTSK